jgi:hypothetical protein
MQHHPTPPDPLQFSLHRSCANSKMRPPSDTERGDLANYANQTNRDGKGRANPPRVTRQLVDRIN